MNYIFENNVLVVEGNGLNITQEKNSYTNEPFKTEKEALKWLRDYTSYIGQEFKISFNTNTLKFKAQLPKNNEDIFGNLQVINFDNDKIVYEKEISLDEINNNFILPSLDKGTYYIDIKFGKGYCLFNKNNNLVQIKNEKTDS